MDAPKAAVRLSVLAGVALLVTLVFVSVSEEGAATPTPVMLDDGSPFVLGREEGVSPATWGPKREPVLVVVTRQAVLQGVEDARGEGEATRAVALPEGLAVFATSARSNHLGCTGTILGTLGASKDIADYDGDGVNDGRFMDSCHQGQWDVFHRGEPQSGPTCGRLAALAGLELRGDRLFATGFDGPVGAQRC